MSSNSKKVGEVREILDAIGHENEKQGIKWTKYFMNEWDLEETRKRNSLIMMLDSTAKRNLTDYRRLLMEVLGELLYSIDLPPQYRTKHSLNDKGIKVTLIDPHLATYERGTKISYVGRYDLSAIEHMALDCEYEANQIEKKRSNGNYKTKGGIYLS